MLTDRTNASAILSDANILQARRAREALSRVEAATLPEYLRFSELPEEVAIPKAAMPLIAQILDAIGKGERVRLLVESREVSTQNAAEILGVSRPFFIHLLDSAYIPFRYVGAYRRIRLSDLLAYQAEQERRNDSLTQLVADAQELNMGY